MPVPDSHYTRRYGREDSATPFATSAYTRSNTTRSSYLTGSGYSKSSTLPPRPPSILENRKYDSFTNRFLTSSSTVGNTRATIGSTRDYGYRTSISPVRTTSSHMSSIRRGMEQSISERLKALELGEKDPGPSRYRNSRSSSYTRDRSGSRELLKSTSDSVSSATRSLSKERRGSGGETLINGYIPEVKMSTESCSNSSEADNVVVITNVTTSTTNTPVSSSASSDSKYAKSAVVNNPTNNALHGSEDDGMNGDDTKFCDKSSLDQRVIKTGSNSFIENIDESNNSANNYGSYSNKGRNKSVSCHTTKSPPKVLVHNILTSPSTTVAPTVTDDMNGNPIPVVVNGTESHGDRVSPGKTNDSDSNANLVVKKYFTKELSPNEVVVKKPKNKSKVIIHSIAVEGQGCSNKSPSPEPIQYTIKPPKYTGKTGSGKVLSQPEEGKNSSPFSDANAEFNIALPRRRSSETVQNGGVEINGSAFNSHDNDTNATSSKKLIETNLDESLCSSEKVDGNSSNNSCNKINDLEATSHGINGTASVNNNRNDAVTTNLNAPNVSPSDNNNKRNSNSSFQRSITSNSRSSSPKEKNGTHINSLGSGEEKVIQVDEDSVDAVGMGGPHSSRFAYSDPSSSQSVGINSYRNPSTLGSSSDFRHAPVFSQVNVMHQSDSSDNESDAYSSGSPQIGRFRSRDANDKSGLNGLRNIGNTCFMNSVLQCLSNTKPLLEYVLRENYKSDVNSTNSAMKGSLIKSFADLIKEIWRESRVVDTSDFKDQIQRFAPRFMGYSQQDAQEFLRYFLEGLHEDVNRVRAKPQPITTDIDDSLSDSQKATESWKRYLRYDDSKIVDLFVGQLKSTLKCTVCGHSSVTFDPFWDLSLPIPSRANSVKLFQCFELFTKEEILDGDEKPTCAKCQCRRKCTKSFSIQKFPRILVIHLKRFSPTERYRGKLSTLVDYPINSLDLSAYAASRGANCTYNLYGISNHSGSTYSGHYIAYCKHPYSGEWHCYNDSRVSPLSQHSIVSTEGYVLFYELAGQSSQL